MNSKTSELHPLLQQILDEAGVDPPKLADKGKRSHWLLQIDDLIHELMLDRELLERSLSLSSEETHQHFVRMAHSARMAAVGEMAGNIAHEINNPLQSLMFLHEGIARRLKKRGDADSELILADMQKIRLNLDRVAKIVRGLKTASRDGTNDDFAVTELETTIHETLSLCAAKIREKKIDLRVPQAITPAKFWSRAAQVSQVLINLLNNASDAVEMAPEPERRWIELGIENTESSIRFTIHDSGPGVPRELEEKIMQPFYTTKPLGRGTGLGLSLSKSIAKDHGGNLTLNRAVSPSCFVFEISKNANQLIKPRDTQ